MRYLKLFQEKLKEETYKSAISKLKEIGHVDRAKNMEKILYSKTDFSDYGYFNVWVRVDIEELTKSEMLLVRQEGLDISPNGYHKMPMLSFSSKPIKAKIKNVIFDSAYFYDCISSDDSPIYISFEIEIDFDSIEVSSEVRSSLMKITSGRKDDKSIELFSLFPNLIGESNNGESESNISEIKRDNISTMEVFECRFSDRKSATKFKSLLKDVFSNKKKVYPGDKDDLDGRKLTITEVIRDCILCQELKDNGLNFDMNDVQSFFDNITSIRTNLLYSENGKW